MNRKLRFTLLFFLFIFTNSVFAICETEDTLNNPFCIRLAEFEALNEQQAIEDDERQEILELTEAVDDVVTSIKLITPFVTGNVLDNDWVCNVRPCTQSVSANGLASAFFSGAQGLYGTLFFNSTGEYTYSLDGSNPVIQALKDGETVTDTFSYTMLEPWYQHPFTAKLTIVIHGNSATLPPEIQAIKDGIVANPDSGTVTKNGQLTYTGNTSLNDSGAISTVLTSSPTSKFGNMTIDNTGAFSYTVFNDLPEVQSLGVGENIVDQFTYMIIGELGFTSTSTITITINGNLAQLTPEEQEIKDSIFALSDENTVIKNNLLTISGNVMANDSGAFNPIGSQIVSLTAFLTSNPTSSYGHLQFNNDGEYIYTLFNDKDAIQELQEGDFLVDTFMYSIEGFNGYRSSAKLTIYILGNRTDLTPELQVIKDNVVARTDQASVIRDSILSASGNVNANDSGVLTSVLNTPPNSKYGSITFESDGSYTYVLDNDSLAVQSIPADSFAIDTFTYTITGLEGFTDTAKLLVLILGNDAISEPQLSIVALDDIDSVVRETRQSTTGNVGINDFNAANFILTSPVPPAPVGKYGTFNLDDTGEYTYSLNQDSTLLDNQCGDGPDPVIEPVDFVFEEFTYSIEGDFGLTNPGDDAVFPGFDEAKIRIYVLCDETVLTPEEEVIRDNTFALDDQSTVIKDILFVTEGNVNNNDSGVQTTLLTSDANTDFGSLTFASDGSFIYVLDNDSPAVGAIPDDGFAVDEFSYKIIGEKGFTDTAKLSIIILGKDAANVAQPELSVVALDDSNTAVRTTNTTATGNVGDNDFGAENFIFTSLSPIGTYGAIQFSNDGNYTYALADDSAGSALDTACASPDPGFVTEQFEYSIQGVNGIINPGFDTATLTIYIICDPNADPGEVQGIIDSIVALPDEYTVVKNNVLTASGNVTSNDQGALNVELNDPPVGTYGTLQINSSGEFTYDLFNDLEVVQEIPFDEFREEVYSYTITGEGGFTKTTTLTFRILGNATALVDNVEVEINDRSSEATPIASGSTMKGHLLSSSDKDWFEINSDGDKIIHIELCPQGSSCFNENSWVLYVFNGGDLTLAQETATIPLFWTRDDTGAVLNTVFSNHLYLNYRSGTFSGAVGGASLIGVIDPCFGDENTLDIGVGPGPATYFVAISSPLLGDDNSNSECGGGNVILERQGPEVATGDFDVDGNPVLASTTEQFITAFPFRDDQYAFTVTERDESPQALSVADDEMVTTYDAATGLAVIPSIRINNDLYQAELRLTPATGALGAATLEIVDFQLLQTGLRGNPNNAIYNEETKQAHFTKIKVLQSGMYYKVTLLYYGPTDTRDKYLEILSVEPLN